MLTIRAFSITGTIIVYLYYIKYIKKSLLGNTLGKGPILTISKTIINIYRVRMVIKNLEKSLNFKTAFSRPGKVLEK